MAKLDPPSDATLRGIPLFEGLSDDERRQLANIARLSRFEPGDLILHEGQPGATLWVILEGQCEVIREVGNAGAPREPIVLARLVPHEHFGEMTFFHPAPHSASVRACTPVTLLGIERAEFDRLDGQALSAAHKLKDHALRTLAARIRQLDRWVTDLLTQDGPPRRIEEWKTFRQKIFNSWKP